MERERGWNSGRKEEGEGERKEERGMES